MGHTGIPQNCCSSRGNDGKPMDLGYFIVRQSHVCQFFLMSVPTWLLPGPADVQGVRHCRHATASQRFSVEVAIHKRLVEGKFWRKICRNFCGRFWSNQCLTAVPFPFPTEAAKLLFPGSEKSGLTQQHWRCDACLKLLAGVCLKIEWNLFLLDLWHRLLASCFREFLNLPNEPSTRHRYPGKSLEGAGCVCTKPRS